jgi:hypothetical protein
VRGKELHTQCLQYWNPKNSPRFFALTCDMVGEAFTKLKDVGDEFNYIFATARHISAKCREELATIDPEQHAALTNVRCSVRDVVAAYLSFSLTCCRMPSTSTNGGHLTLFRLPIKEFL